MGEESSTTVKDQESHLLSRSGMTISGLMRARLWSAKAASMVPNLLNMAIFMAGMRHCTKASTSSSVSLAWSGMVLYHRGVLKRSLQVGWRVEGGVCAGRRVGGAGGYRVK